ncbi:MAG: carboxypeptidase regulatory-like domain-containing protein [Fimbriimonadia bacterium]|nr:carboxypeptidase regulatory-like domain-containing protein [Fimbriimonadia bacterium]
MNRRQLNGHAWIALLAVLFAWLCQIPSAWAVGSITGAITKNSAPMNAPYAPFLDVFDSLGRLRTSSVNASGQFTVNDLAPGSASVNVYAAPNRYIGFRNVTVINGQTVTSNFDWSVGSISGRVQRGTTALANARIEVSDSNNNLFQATTNASGDFTINDLTVGTVNIYLHDANGLFLAYTTAVVTRGQTTTVNFNLPRSGRVTGTVTKNGAVIQGARIDVLDVDGNWFTQNTNASGTYNIQNVAPGAATVYCFTPDGIEVEIRQVTVPVNNAVTADFAYSTGTIQGNVRRGGVGVQNAVVITDRGEQATSAANGSYTMEAISGQKQLTCYSQDGYLIGTGNTNLPAGGSRTVHFDWNVGNVRGVITRGGQPLVGATVRLDAITGETFFGVANGSGNYLIETVPVGDVDATARTAEYFFIGRQQGTLNAGAELVLNFVYAGTYGDPDPFNPTGSNTTTIRVTDAPNQTGITVDLLGINGGWRWTTNNTNRIALTETPVGSGNYQGTWSANASSPVGQSIWQDDTYTIQVFDPNGVRVPELDGQVAVRGVASITPSRTTLTLGVDTVQIDVQCAPSLENLELRISRGATVIRALPLTGGASRSVVWDGRNTAGNLVSGGNYTMRVFNTVSNRGYAVSQPLRVQANVTSLTAAPDPYTSNGCTNLVINVTATPNQTGVRARIVHPTAGDFLVNLTETSAGSGSYTGQWTGMNASNQILPDGDLTIFWRDQDNLDSPVTRTVRYRSIDSIFVTPEPFFEPTLSETATITVRTNAVTGLNLEAQIYTGTTLIRALPMTESAGTYTCVWDGLNTGGSLPAAGTYTVQIFNSDCNPKRRYTLTSSVILRQPRVIFVNANAPGPTFNGQTWATAYRTLQEAITNAGASGEIDIWVAQGAYNERLTVRAGIGMYGGFAGTEVRRNQRDFRNRETIIDGQRGGVVLNFTSPNINTVLDGFTIRNGQGTTGGGVLLNGIMTIANCRFIDNRAASGGGIHTTGAATFINNFFIGNGASATGGGIHATTNVSIISCVFQNNYAQDAGGGIHLTSGTATRIINNTLAENYALQGGAVSIAGGTNTLFVNNLFAYNSSGLNRTSGTMIIRNNCAFGNEDYDYNGLDNPTGTDGNISANPLLADVPNRNLHIQPNSPCRNAGDNSVIPVGWVDMDGQNRLLGIRVEIGADESNGTNWTPANPKVLFVRVNGNDNSTGLNWNQAKRTLTGALAAANAADEIWVAQGTYIERITLKHGVGIYGGFNGTETLRSQRNPVSNLTIIDAQRAGTVVTVPAGTLQTTVFDGFIVRNGQAANGGGLNLYATSATISGNQVENNIVTAGGGGLFASFSSPIIQNNDFIANSAVNGGGVHLATCVGQVDGNEFFINSATSGGGFYATTSPGATLTNSMFMQNNATNGGGAFLTANFGGVDNCLFAMNSATTSGGGLSVNSTTTTVANCDFTGNFASSSGGGVFSTGNVVSYLRNLFTGNSAGTDGGGLYLTSAVAGSVVANNTLNSNFALGNGGGFFMNAGNALVANNTFVSNFAQQGGGVALNAAITSTVANNLIAFNSSGLARTGTGTLTLSVNNNCVFGNEVYQFAGITDPTGSNGNLSVDPLLANRFDGNLHIQPTSPCRNAGDNSVVVATWRDMDNQNRILNGTVDIGADESDGTNWPGPNFTIIRVRTTGNDSNNGSAWNQAKRTIAGALSAAVPGDEIWVAQGTYNERITLRSGVALYGGFNATETQRDQRNFVTRITIIDGQRGGSVVTLPNGSTADTILDGFTIRNGQAVNGGGIFSNGSSARVQNCLITNNIATTSGGGAYFTASTPALVANSFTFNNAVNGGGLFAISSNVNSSQNVYQFNNATNGAGVNAGVGGVINLNNDTVQQNSAVTNGGGVFSGGVVNLQNSLIAENSATTGGGAYNSSSTLDIRNSSISNNLASGQGGGFFATGGTSRILSSTISGNRSVTEGGGGCFNSVTSASGSVVANNMVVNNVSQPSGGGLFLNGSSLPIINNTLVQNFAVAGGGLTSANSTSVIGNNLLAHNSSGLFRSGAGAPTLRSNCAFGNEDYDYLGLSDPNGTNGNFSADPLLANRFGGDFRIQPNSPCRDSGENALLQPGWVDFEGQVRLPDDLVDVGADESDGTNHPGGNPRIIRVRPTGNDSNNGNSWAQAKRTITGALSSAVPGDEIWVASGTYNERITLKTHVGLYGGFASGETQRSQRNWVNNLTILDGQRGGSVVTVPAGALQTTVFDGFVVRNGQAANGGGLNAFASSAMVRNNLFANNIGTTNGGGIYGISTSLWIGDNTFNINNAPSGGGLFLTNSAGDCINNLFSVNSATNGGGIHLNASTVNVLRSRFQQNSSTTNGGGIYNSSSNLTALNNLFIANNSPNGGGIYVTGGVVNIANNLAYGNTSTNGGAIYLNAPAANSLVANNTMADNSATTHGGGVFIAGTITLANNLIAFNTRGLHRASGTATLRNNCVFGNTTYDYSGQAAGTGDISLDPLFVNRANLDYHLRAGSPCINAGENSFVSPDWVDIDGEPRIQGANVDIGADEVGSSQEGDVNGDGCVNDSDLLLVLFAFGQTGSNLPEDLNNDGVVNDSDLLLVLFNFGVGC